MTIFEGALSAAHLAAKIELHEPDDHILILRCGGNVIATYSATGVKVETIRKDATEWLERHNENMPSV